MVEPRPAGARRARRGVGARGRRLAPCAARRAQPLDPMERLEAEFSKLAKDLPPAGEVGYLERYEDAGAEDAVRAHYAAQYALVPRVVVSRVGHEFMIVAHGHAAARPRSAARRLLPGVGDARGSPGVSAPGPMIAAVVGLFLPIGAAWWGLRALRLRPATDSRLTTAAVACCLGIGLSSLTTFARGVAGPVSRAGVRRRRRGCCGWRSARPPGGRAGRHRSSRCRRGPAARAGALGLAGARRIRGGRHGVVRGAGHRVPGGPARTVGRVGDLESEGPLPLSRRRRLDGVAGDLLGAAGAPGAGVVERGPPVGVRGRRAHVRAGAAVGRLRSHGARGRHGHAERGSHAGLGCRFGAGGAVRVLASRGRANGRPPGVDAGRDLAGDAAAGRPAGVAESAASAIGAAAGRSAGQPGRVDQERGRGVPRGVGAPGRVDCAASRPRPRHGLVGGGCCPGPRRGGLVQAGPDRGRVAGVRPQHDRGRSWLPGVA